MPPDQETTQTNPTPDSSPTSPSDAPETAPEAPEAPGEGFTPESTNSTINKGDAEITQLGKEPETATTPENQASTAPQSQTAQTPVNEPLENKSKPSLARQLLISARNAIQFRKRKKLDHVMSLFLQKSKITNDEVEKFLHVSDATATRYLSQLEKEGKIKQSGKTGHMVSYSRI